MKAYSNHQSVAVVLNRSNIDTDQIIPKQFLKKVERSGFGQHLFYHWRYNSDGSVNKNFVLNRSSSKAAKILVAGDNFGCGSSREHAAWSIADYGINTIISTSYADIFYSNCFKNCILPIVVNVDELAWLMSEIDAKPGMVLTVDLELQVVSALGRVLHFSLDCFYKQNLQMGLDDIDLTLTNCDAIAAFEVQQQRQLPWLWA